MPESVAVQIEEVSEEALRERVKLRKVTAAVTLYDQLLQTGKYTQRLFPFLKMLSKTEIWNPGRHGGVNGNHPGTVRLVVFLWRQRPCFRGGTTDWGCGEWLWLTYMHTYTGLHQNCACLAILYYIYKKKKCVFSGAVSRRAKDEEIKSPPGFRIEIVMERKQ